MEFSAMFDIWKKPPRLQDYIKYLMKQATTENKNWNFLALQYFCLILLCFTLRNWLANKLLLSPSPQKT